MCIVVINSHSHKVVVFSRAHEHYLTEIRQHSHEAYLTHLNIIP